MIFFSRSIARQKLMNLIDITMKKFPDREGTFFCIGIMKAGLELGIFSEAEKQEWVRGLEEKKNDQTV